MQDSKLEIKKENMEKLKKALFQVSLEEVLKLGLDLNHIYLLEKFELGKGIEITPKTSSWIQGLVRKGFLLDDFKVTESGGIILDKLRNGETSISDAVKANMTAKLDEFEKWWEAFPPTDTFVYRGKVFKGSRHLRQSKAECKVKFYLLLKQGKYTAEELIEALKMEVGQKKEESFKNRENKLKYMHNSLTYLNKQDYDGFVETAKLLKKAAKETNSEAAAGGAMSI